MLLRPCFVYQKIWDLLPKNFKCCLTKMWNRNPESTSTLRIPCIQLLSILYLVIICLSKHSIPIKSLLQKQLIFSILLQNDAWKLPTSVHRNRRVETRLYEAVAQYPAPSNTEVIITGSIRARTHSIRVYNSPRARFRIPDNAHRRCATCRCATFSPEALRFFFRDDWSNAAIRSADKDNPIRVAQPNTQMKM